MDCSENNHDLCRNRILCSDPLRLEEMLNYINRNNSAST